MERLTPTRQEVAAELFSIDTGINCFEDAIQIIDVVHHLVTVKGESGLSIIRWLTLLPRARDRNTPAAAHLPAVQMTLLTPLAGKTGHHMPAPHTLLDPDAVKSKPGARADREARRRPARAHCVDCGVEFAMNPTGRPALRCAKHRQQKRTA